MDEQVETIVIGAGQAGLAISWHLSQRGCEHLVLERARIAERWRTQRWDSLCFQFPNWGLELPDHPPYTGGPPMRLRTAVRSGGSSRNTLPRFVRPCDAE
jgi:putative flavoprotein involved in K+ transport